MDSSSCSQPVPSGVAPSQKAWLKSSKSTPNKMFWRSQMDCLQRHLGLKKHPGEAQQYIWEPPPILISIDVEAWEFDQKRITEVGLSVLDCAEILNVNPGPNGSDWFSMIQARHFLIRENKGYVNKRHVPGHPDKFQFGQTEVIKQNDLTQYLREYFQSLPYTPHMPNMNSPVCREVVLIGHAVENDVKYLKTLGFNVSAVIASQIDTMELGRVVLRTPQAQSLVKLLNCYDLPWAYLHNAGNDACYTLRLAIAMCVDHVRNKKSSTYWQNLKDARIEKAVEEAIAKVMAELQGWSSDEEEEQYSQPTNASIKPLATNNGPMKAANTQPAPKHTELSPNDATNDPSKFVKQGQWHSNQPSNAQPSYAQSSYTQQLQEIYTSRVPSNTTGRVIPLADGSNSAAESRPVYQWGQNLNYTNSGSRANAGKPKSYRYRGRGRRGRQAPPVYDYKDDDWGGGGCGW